MIINHIRSNDLNLLKVFCLLLVEGNLTRAAARLGLTQPALSRALARLRADFDDPLFVRAPGGMLPTPKALALEKPLTEALERLEAIYSSPRAFSPAEASGVVRIATTDYFEQVVWTDLVGRLSKEAPNLTFATQMTGSEIPTSALRDGEVQLAVAGYFHDVPAGFMRQSLFSDHFVSVVRRGHPLVKKQLTLDAFLKLGHLIISPRGDLFGAVDTALHARGKKRHVAASVCSFLSSIPLVASSDLILTAPARLIERAKRAGVELAEFEPPIDLPAINVVQVWHERFQHDPMHIWLRQALLVKS